MKKTTLLIIVLVTLLFATPTFAREKEPTGDRIDIQCPAPQQRFCSETQDYSANEPFYISHGWILSPRELPGQDRFQLEVDGIIAKPTYIEYTTVVGEGGPALYRTWFFNFPDGMTGSHAFTGHWIVPCLWALYSGEVTECANPMADYDYSLTVFVINFK